jgi:hypothetical protein
MAEVSGRKLTVQLIDMVSRKSLYVSSPVPVMDALLIFTAASPPSPGRSFRMAASMHT